MTFGLRILNPYNGYQKRAQSMGKCFNNLSLRKRDMYPPSVSAWKQCNDTRVKLHATLRQY